MELLVFFAGIPVNIPRAVQEPKFSSVKNGHEVVFLCFLFII